MKVEKIFYRGKSAHFSRDYKNFDDISKGEIIGFSDGNEVIYDEDAVMILPKKYGNQGDEWFYV